MTKLSTLFAIIFASVYMASAAVHADEGKPTIAVLNIQEIMRDSTAAKSIKTQFDAKQKAYSSEISSKEQALQKEQQELAKQRGVLKQDEFEKKVRDFNQKAATVQKDVQAKKQALDKGLSQAFGEIQKVVSGILADMAKDKGFKVVVPTQQILYSDPALDVTPEVLSKLNAKLSTVSVKF